MPLLVGGIILLIAGIILKLFPPTKINNFYGWRSNYAQKNKKTWNEAQKYGAKQLISGGIIAIIAGSILVKIFTELSKHFYGLVFLIIVVLVIYRVEHHLRKIFDEKGNRKEK